MWFVLSNLLLMPLFVLFFWKIIIHKKTHYIVRSTNTRKNENYKTTTIKLTIMMIPKKKATDLTNTWQGRKIIWTFNKPRSVPEDVIKAVTNQLDKLTVEPSKWKWDYSNYEWKNVLKKENMRKLWAMS